MDKQFYHTGSFGDIIYSLPTVRAMGGGDFVCDMPMAQTRIIQDLLEFQPYITKVMHRCQTCLQPDFINLSKFHQDPGLYKNHLRDTHMAAQGMMQMNTEGLPWLSAPSLPKYLTGTENEFLNKQPFSVVNITPRYRDKFFNWTREVNYLFRQVEHVLFVGYISEFQGSGMEAYKGGIFGQNKIYHIQTRTMIQAAAVIKQAALFSGNQSSMLAIRQGLGLPYRMEVAPHHPNCCQYIPQETILNPISRRAHRLLVTAKEVLLNRH